MKILFVWEVAGVASIMAKALRKRGHEVNVIGLKSHDGFKFLDFYNEMSLEGDGIEFDEKVLKYLQGKDIDIVHVNSGYELAYKIKVNYPRMKVFLQYHGSDARLTPVNIRQHYEGILDGIFYSTPDLNDYMIYPSTYIPLMIDEEHFKQTNHNMGALFIKPKDQFLPPVNLTYTTIDRDNHPIEYRYMPELFEKYNVYIDVRIDKDVGLVKPLSKTALEALSTGMWVYTKDGSIITHIPEIHTEKNVIDILENEYRKP